MDERTTLAWTINGKEARLSATVAALLALEDQGLCIVTMAMRMAADANKFLLTPGQAAMALAVGERQRQLEEKQKPPVSLEARRTEILAEARRLPQGTAKLCLEGTGYLAEIQKDMAESTEAGGGTDPKV